MPELFRAYVTEDKIMQTFKLAEQHGINAVFESGAQFVHRYNKELGGHMQIIPSIHPDIGQSDAAIKDEIKSIASSQGTASESGPGTPDGRSGW